MDSSASQLRVAAAVLAAMEARGVDALMIARATGIPLRALRARLDARSPFTLAELVRVAECLEVRPSSLLEPKAGIE